MKKFIWRNLYPIIFLLVTAIISFLNYKSGTYLTGWDTLHPEFDFQVNFERLIYGVWRDDQGFGAVAGHSHMADLPRVIFMWLMHFIFPLNSLRYLYVFLCFIIGPIGLYYLVEYLISYLTLSAKNKKITNATSIYHHTSPLATQTIQHYLDRLTPFSLPSIIAFLSAAFYLFNLSTVQQFYVPFEMFPAQWAFLPWIMLYTFRYLKEGGKKNLALFSLFTVFAIPQAYAAHLWYPFLLIYGSFLCLYFLQFGEIKHRPKIKLTKHSLAVLKKIIVLGLFTITLNSYWLFPNIYFIAKDSYIFSDTKQNRIFSEEYRLRTREDGYIDRVALVRGFYMNWNIEDFNREKFVPLMPEWVKHINNKYIVSIGYGFFAISLTGLILAFKKREKNFIAMAPAFIFSFMFLANRQFPFDLVYSLFLKNRLFEEASRFIFTKFSILMIFAYVMFFAYALYVIFSRYKNIWLLRISSCVIVVLLVIYAFPMFQGHLISDKVRLKIPDEYFSLWKYMKKQPNGMVLTLPMHNFAGWQFYDWGYQGSGFIWFPIKQPVLDRDSDRWSIPNEQSFREFNYSLYSRNSEYFSTNIEKYNIQYIIWDKHVITWNIKNRKQIVYEREISNILTDLIKKGTIEAVQEFGSIQVYKVKQNRQMIEMKSIHNGVSPVYRWHYFDFAYRQWGDYITSVDDSATQTSYDFPFREIINPTDRIKQDALRIDKASQSYIINSPFKKDLNKEIIAPSIIQAEQALFTNVYITRNPQGTYKLLFDFLLPKHIVEPVTYDTSLLGGTKTTVSVNGQQLVFDTRLVNTKTPLYIGQVFLYTKLANYLNGKKMDLHLSQSVEPIKINDLFSKLPLHSIGLTAPKIVEANPGAKGITLKSNPVDGEYLNFKTRASFSGIYVDFDSLPHNIGYILAVTSRNLEGLPMRICLRNLYSYTCTYYDGLTQSKNFVTDYFLIPPTGDSMGYAIAIDNFSLGRYDTVNDLKEIALIPFPTNYLSQIYYQPVFKNRSADKVSYGMSVIRHAAFLWEIDSVQTDKVSDDTTIMLKQSFNKDWKAFAVPKTNFAPLRWLSTSLPFIFGEKLDTQIIVNNWANGWRIRDPQALTQVASIVLVFVPQYLQITGYFLLLLSFVAVVFIEKKK